LALWQLALHFNMLGSLALLSLSLKVGLKVKVYGYIDLYIALHREKLASEALRYGSQFFYTLQTT